MARPTRRSWPTTTRLIWNSASSREAASSGPLTAADFLVGGIFAPLTMCDESMLDYECERPLKPSWLYLWSSSAFPQVGHRPSRREEDDDDERRHHSRSGLAPRSVVFRTTPVLGRPDLDR